MDIGTWQYYYNYAMFNIYNHASCCLSSPSCQHLNSQRFAEVFASAELIDLTKDEVTSECHGAKLQEESKGLDSCSTSSTEALDFKLTCENCKRNLTSKKRLENHLIKCSNKNSSEKSMEKPFPCSECLKRFMKKNGLTKHIKMCHENKTQTEAQAAKKEVETIRSIFHNVSRLAESDGHK